MSDQQPTSGSQEPNQGNRTEFKLERKVQDMMAYGLDAIVQYPKVVKFTMGDHMIEVMNTVADKTIEVKKKRTKKTTLENLDIAIDQLRFFIRLSFAKKYISQGRYDVWSAKVDEIGSMVGGMIKNEQPRYSKTGE